jgi:transglutaminase-like putative cysteine protease
LGFTLLFVGLPQIPEAQQARPSRALLNAANHVANLDLMPLQCASDQSAQVFLNLPPDVAWVLNKWMPHDLALNIEEPSEPLDGIALHLNRLLLGNPGVEDLDGSIEALADAGLASFFIPRLMVFPERLLVYLQKERCTHPLILLAFARQLDRDGLTQAALQEIASCSELPQVVRRLIKAQVLIDHGELKTAETLLKSDSGTRAPSCHTAVQNPQGSIGQGRSAFELRMKVELALRKNELRTARRQVEELSRWFNRDPDSFALYVDLSVRLGNHRLIRNLLENLRRDPRLDMLRWILLDRVATLSPGPEALELLDSAHADLLEREGGFNHAFYLALASGQTARARAYRNQIASPPKDLDRRLNYQEGLAIDIQTEKPTALLGDTILRAAESRLGVGTLLLNEKIQITVGNDRKKSIHYRWVFGRSHKSDGDDAPIVRVTTDPGRESMYISEVFMRCGDRSGTLSAQEDFEDLAEADLRIFYNLREHRFQFPPLEPGCVASLDVTVQELDSLPFDGYFGREVPLDRGWPTRRFELRYSLPRGVNLHSKVVGPTQGGEAPDFAGAAQTNQRGGMDFTYILHDLKTRDYKRNLPGGSDLSASLLVSTFANPEALAAWYHRWGIGPPRAVSTDRVQEVFGASVDGTSREKLLAAYNFVSKEIRYVGLEFGVHSYQPYPVATVLKRRFGDCKDKARLMRDLLHSVGIKSHMVLVRPRNYGRLPKDDQRLPLPLDSFFHALLAVELPGRPGFLFVDPTNHERSLETIPALVQDGTALVLKPGFPRLIRLPVAKATDNTDRTHILLARDRMIIEAELSGILASPARRTDDLEKGVRAWLDGAFDGGLIAQSSVSIEQRDVDGHIILNILVQFPEGQSPSLIRPIYLLNASCSQLPDPDEGLRGDLLAARLRKLEVTLDTGGTFPSAHSTAGDMLQYTVPNAMQLNFTVEESRTEARFEVGQGPKGDLSLPNTYLNDVHAICTSLIDLRTRTLRPRWTP